MVFGKMLKNRYKVLVFLYMQNAENILIISKYICKCFLIFLRQINRLVSIIFIKITTKLNWLNIEYISLF